MQLRGEVQGVRVFDDFAHHPTAISLTLAGLRKSVGPDKRVIAVLEPRSNTMRMGIHESTLAASLSLADRIWLHCPPDMDWNLNAAMAELGDKVQVMNNVDALSSAIASDSSSGDQIVVMSNGSFDGIHEKLLLQLDKETIA